LLLIIIGQGVEVNPYLCRITMIQVCPFEAGKWLFKVLSLNPDGGTDCGQIIENDDKARSCSVFPETLYMAKELPPPASVIS